MSGNDNIKGKQGAIKLEELRSNRSQEVIGTTADNNALTLIEQIRKITQDSLRRAGLILTSTGQITWNGTEILFESAGNVSDINLKLLQNESGSARTITLKLQGTSGPAAAQAFDQILLGDNDILYLQLNRETILSEAAADINGEVIIENQVNGESGVSGKTALVAASSKTTGVPFLASPIGSNSDTFNIPLAICLHRTVGLDTFKDIWWIPHGIRWPENTVSTIGAIIVEGQDTYPTAFAGNETQLDDALSLLSSSGGVICLSDSFSIAQHLTVPSNIKIIGRKSETTITFNAGGQLVLGADTELKDIRMTADSGFSGNMVVISGTRALIDNCIFDITAPSSVTTGVRVEANDFRLEKNKFLNVESTSNVGINLSGAFTGIDIDSKFT